MLAAIKGLLRRLHIRRIRIPRRVRNITVSASILLIVLIAAGTAYTWYTDRQSPHTPVMPASDTASYEPVTPKMPAPNAAEGVAAQMVTSPVSRGNEATVSVQTDPTSTCKIAVVYGYDPSKKQMPVSDPALAPQVADAYGSVSWTWTVNPNAALGKGNATVTCTFHTHSGVLQSEVDITE